MRLSILGSGKSRTIIDARYQGAGIALNSNADYSTIKNLRVTRSENSTSCCSFSSMRAGIVISNAEGVTIDNVHFYETYIGIMTYFANSLEVKNSEFDRGTLSSHYSGLYLWYGTNMEIKNNVIQKYQYGIYLYYTREGLEVYDNHIHNSTSYGIYTYRLQYGSAGNPYEFKRNILADNNNSMYSSGCCSTSYNRYFLIEENTFRSSSNIQLYGYYYSYDWVIENNTFDGDSDSTYGTYLQRGNNAKVGNNTFTGHGTKDMYFLYCGTGTTNFIKLFYNTYTSIQTSSCLANVYHNLNVKTVEEDSDAFSGVEIEIKDSSKTYYETPHWGGSDELTDNSGFISNSMMIRSGYYSSSTTITENNLSLIHI